jgi:hypothetical protein
MFSPISCDCKRFPRHFVPASGAACDMGRLNAGVRNSEAFARTRKTRSRELALRTCPAFLNKLANENADAATRTAAPANVAGRGRMKPAIRDARASARSAEFRRVP